MNTTNRLLAPLLSAAMLALVAGSAAAQVRVRPPQQVPPTGAEDAAPLTQTDAQGIKTLQAITSRSFEGLTFEQRADGTLGIDLQGRFQHVLLATPGPNGSLNLSCHSGDHANAASLASIEPWRPARNGSLLRLDVSSIRASSRNPISVAPKLEEK
jgi:hypothetical protein